MTLNELVRGESGIVVALCFGETEKRRLSSMGIIPGVRMTFLRTAPGGDPSEYGIMGYNIAIRRSDAENIIVKKDGG